MKCSYADIRNRIPETPLWWDEHAVPRYCAFRPDEVANIYARECALVRIDCQSCGEQFRVAFSWDNYELGRNEDGTAWVKATDPMTVERVQRLHYGDPPNGMCCATGAVMNSEPVRVIEFWSRRDNVFEWKRVPELELRLDEEGDDA